MMKIFRIVLIAILSLQAAQSIAKDGYKVQLKFTDIKDSSVYLAHYFGKPLPTIFKTDSAKIDKNGVAVMQAQDGGYIILGTTTQGALKILTLLKTDKDGNIE